MAWTRLEPGFSRHPKRLKCGPVASWLWMCSLDHCTEYRTNGYVERAVVATLANGLTRGQRTRAIQKLLDVKSWEEVEGGYIVHGYLEHNVSALQVEKERASARARYYRRRDRGDTHSDPSPENTPRLRPEFARTHDASVSQSVIKEELLGGSTLRGDAAPPSALESASSPRPPAASPAGRQLTREEQLALAALPPGEALSAAARLRTLTR